MTTPTLKAYGIDNPQALVLNGIKRGWIGFSVKITNTELAVRLKYNPNQRLLQARLRAERNGQDVSMYPPRIRRRRS